jgi:hypothetical protein
MTKWKHRSIIVALFVLAVVDAGAQSRAVFVSVKGKVEVKSSEERTWRPASAGMEVPVNATVSTGFGGGAVLELGDSTLTVRQHTRLRIDELSTRDNATHTNLTMPVGRILAKVKTTGGARGEFRVRSPVSTAAVRGTSFETDGTRLDVFESTVTFLSESGIGIAVHSGETGVTRGGGSPSGGAAQREMNTAVNPYTSLTESGGIGGGAPGLGVGVITVNWP